MDNGSEVCYGSGESKRDMDDLKNGRMREGIEGTDVVGGSDDLNLPVGVVETMRRQPLNNLDVGQRNDVNGLCCAQEFIPLNGTN